jgi:hypothetical protein
MPRPALVTNLQHARPQPHLELSICTDSDLPFLDCDDSTLDALMLHSWRGTCSEESLGAQIGFFGILHTWRQNLRF